VSRSRLRVLFTAPMFAALLFSPSLFGRATGTPGPALAAPVSISFGPTTIVDDQRLAGEPDIKICGPNGTWSYGSCGQDNPYASVPWGFSTTSSFLWRSEDQSQTFKLVPGNTLYTGKPDLACPGGGDTDLGVSPGATQAADHLNFEDLQGLTNFSVGISGDGGTTFTCSPINAIASGVDRQWYGFYKKPTDSGSRVHLDYDVADANAADASCITPSAGTGTINSTGNLFVVQTSADGGLTYPPFVPVDCDDGIAGNMQVNQTTGEAFAIHTAFEAPASCAAAADAVFVNHSTDGGATWTRSVVYQPSTLNTTTCSGDVTTGQDFPSLAIDTSGNLYAVWSQATVDSAGSLTGPSHIYYSYSTDNGVTWSAEQQVDSGSTDVNIFPWVQAGDVGRVDVVWYGTTSASGAGYDPGTQTTDWYPYLSQSLNANVSTPTFSPPLTVAQHSNHNGGICTMGIGCTAGGDRSLADFFQVDVNASGGAEVIWADTSNNSGNGDNQAALIDEATQSGGPGLFSGVSVTGAAGQVCTGISISPCQTDSTGDAKYEAFGSVGSSVPNLDITGSSVSRDPSDSSMLRVRMNISNLSTYPTVGESGLNTSPTNSADNYVDYLTSWTYHAPGNTQANFDSTGNIYYAYLEVNTATGAVTGAYDGNTCSISTTHGKYLVYPGQNTITHAENQTTGTIDLEVPLTDVGSPASGDSLYSVTAHTIGQVAPAAGTGAIPTCTRDPNGNNQDASGQVFDVYDKSPAYTAILPSPTSALLSRVSAHASGRFVTIRWTVAPGTKALGYNVLAVERHGRRQLNRTLIRSDAGRTYRFTTATSFTLYYLQAVSATHRELLGPYRVQR
jgi:hypothetical protein